MGNHNITLGYLLHHFFTDGLIKQRNSSKNTIVSYRDTWRLFLKHTAQSNKINVNNITIEDVTGDTILGFLEHLEKDRGCCIRSRNQRLAVFKSFFKFAVFVEPGLMLQSERIKMIPSKKYESKVLGYLTKKEIFAIFSAFDKTTKSGMRGYILVQFMYNTGARASEVTTVKACDLKISKGHSHVLIHGKGGKDRIVPIWDDTANLLLELIAERIPDAGNQEFVFKNRNDSPITRSGIRYLLNTAVEKAAIICKSLKSKDISPHTLRHTTAMHLLQSGVDINLIRMWLGHVKLDTTHQYIEADLDMKRKALLKGGIIQPESGSMWKPTSEILDFLDNIVE